MCVAFPAFYFFLYFTSLKTGGLGVFLFLPVFAFLDLFGPKLHRPKTLRKGGRERQRRGRAPKQHPRVLRDRSSFLGLREGRGAGVPARTARTLTSEGWKQLPRWPCRRLPVSLQGELFIPFASCLMQNAPSVEQKMMKREGVLLPRPYCKTAACSRRLEYHPVLTETDKQRDIQHRISTPESPSPEQSPVRRMLFSFFYYILREVFFLLAMSIKALILCNSLQAASQINRASLCGLVGL
nr:PREDICTED: uncharacterized protein LOC106487180 [Apteryx mantelli mantelli]